MSLQCQTHHGWLKINVAGPNMSYFFILYLLFLCETKHHIYCIWKFSLDLSSADPLLCNQWQISNRVRYLSRCSCLFFPLPLHGIFATCLHASSSYYTVWVNQCNNQCNCQWCLLCSEWASCCHFPFLETFHGRMQKGREVPEQSRNAKCNVWLTKMCGNCSV